MGLPRGVRRRGGRRDRSAGSGRPAGRYRARATLTVLGARGKRLRGKRMATKRIKLGQLIKDEAGYMGGGLYLDVPKLINTRAFITASSGGGKSYLLRRIVELIAGRVQVIIIDPEGEFSTLRERYPLLLVGAGGEVAP